MADLPYTYTDDAGDTLTITAGPGARIVVKISIPDDDEQGVTEHVASVVGPKGEDAAHLAHVLLTVGEMGDHMVIARAQVDRLIRAEAVKVAQSMRERAAEAALDDPTADYDIRRQIRALPLLPDGDTLPEEDLVEPGDEAPDLVERLALDLAETTKVVTQRLATVEDRLGITDDTTEDPAPAKSSLCPAESPLPAPGGFPYLCEADAGHDGDHYALRGSETWSQAAPERPKPTRYRDADGDLWEETSPGYLLLDVRRLPHVRMARPYAVVDGEFGPLTPVTTDSPPAPCEVCWRAPDEQEHGPDGQCRHTPATRLGRPTT